MNIKKIKQFVKENKNELICSVIIGGVAATSVILTRRHYVKNFDLIPKGVAYVSWKPDGRFISLESAMGALELNANNKSSFAIIKDGLEYTGILLSDDVIVP